MAMQIARSHDDNINNAFILKDGQLGVMRDNYGNQSVKIGMDNLSWNDLPYLYGWHTVNNSDNELYKWKVVDNSGNELTNTNNVEGSWCVIGDTLIACGRQLGYVLTTSNIARLQLGADVPLLQTACGMVTYSVTTSIKCTFNIMYPYSGSSTGPTRTLAITPAISAPGGDYFDDFKSTESFGCWWIMGKIQF